MIRCGWADHLSWCELSDLSFARIRRFALPTLSTLPALPALVSVGSSIVAAVATSSTFTPVVTVVTRRFSEQGPNLILILLVLLING